jgi:nicotinamidase-related amidase
VDPIVTTPPPPTDTAVVPEGSVLVVVDIQGGSVAAEDTGIPKMSDAGSRQARVDRVKELIAACRASSVPVVFIQEVHKPTLVDFGRELDGAEGIHAVEGEPTTELAPGIEPRPEEYLIRKRRYSAFFATELDLVLRSYGARAVLLVGGLTDICVHYTAVDAHQHDYRIRVIEDCVGGSSQRAHDAALEAMEYLQRDSRVQSADVLAALPVAAGRA